MTTRWNQQLGKLRYVIVTPVGQSRVESEGGEEPQLDGHRPQEDEEEGEGGHGAGRQRASPSRPLWWTAMQGE